MPRLRYQITDEDIAVVHRWAYAKLRDAAWPQPAVSQRARAAFPCEHPTALDLQKWCDTYLDMAQWGQLQAVIRAARRDGSQTRTVRLSTSVYARLHNLAEREQLTLSDVIDRYLADAPPPLPASPPPVELPAPALPPPATPAKVNTKAKRPLTPAQKRSTAFVTSKKGVCYLTIKIGRENFSLMRIRNYTISAQDKRDMRRLHPDVAFDWKKIARQLAEKREVCRQYRSRRRTPRRPRQPREPFYGVIDPMRRTVYVNDPTNIVGVGALLDQIIAVDRLRDADTLPFDE